VGFDLPVLHSTAYGWLMLAGIFVSLTVWSRIARRDERLLLIYIAALAGAFIGAKLVYLGAEGWLHWHDSDRWLELATGKSIIGGLLGGYLAVELAKRFLHYSGSTGDWFAVVTPMSIVLGRVGCILHGCCLGRECDASWYTMNDHAGVARWPAALVELLFNAFALAAVLLLRKRRILPGQHFHLYLMAYGVFRFFHEFLRDTPQILGPFSGYQIASLGVAALGLAGFIVRQKRATPAPDAGVVLSSIE
jgi:phosphatidylglycerol---prolipoprotein diacylglyceryl transferase